jgi:hypothetical protein
MSCLFLSRNIECWPQLAGLTEIHLCHACSCQEILSVETARQVGLSTLRSRKLLMRALAEIQ